MIGIIKDEEQTVFEFNPFFATHTPRWAYLSIKMNNKTFGEYGIAWSKPYKRFTLPNIWINIGNCTYCSLYNFLNHFLIPKIKEMVK